MRRASDVNDLRPGEEQHPPTRAPEARQPVDLFAEHEERLVEQADAVGRLPPDEQRGAREPVGVAGLVVGEAAHVERVQDRRARGELADAEVLGREAPHGGLGAYRTLQGAVLVQEPRTDHRGGGMRVGEGDQPVEPVVQHPGVRVEQEPVATAGDAHAGVVAAAHADVRLLDHARLRKLRAHELERAVGRAVVDDHDLVAPNRLETALEPQHRVQGDDDDRDVSSSHREPAARGGCPPTAPRRARAATTRA